METPPIQYVKTSDGVSIAYAVFGEGPPIVYAAGLTTNLHAVALPAVRATIGALVESGWSVIRYDPRGMGSSDREPLDLSADVRLRDLDAVIDHLGLERFALAGSGILAIPYAVRSPGRVSHLLLIGTFASGAEFQRGVRAMRTVMAMETMVEEDWEYFSLALANAIGGFADADLARQLAAALREGMSAEAWAAYMGQGRDTDVTGLLPLVKVPTLVIHVKSAPLSSVDLQRVLASGIPALDSWLLMMSHGRWMNFSARAASTPRPLAPQPPRCLPPTPPLLSRPSSSPMSKAPPP